MLPVRPGLPSDSLMYREQEVSLEQLDQQCAHLLERHTYPHQADKGPSVIKDQMTAV